MSKDSININIKYSIKKRMNYYKMEGETYDSFINRLLDLEDESDDTTENIIEYEFISHITKEQPALFRVIFTGDEYIVEYFNNIMQKWGNITHWRVSKIIKDQIREFFKKPSSRTLLQEIEVELVYEKYTIRKKKTTNFK